MLEKIQKKWNEIKAIKPMQAMLAKMNTKDGKRLKDEKNRLMEMIDSDNFDQVRNAGIEGGEGGGEGEGEEDTNAAPPAKPVLPFIAYGTDHCLVDDPCYKNLILAVGSGFRMFDLGKRYQDGQTLPRVGRALKMATDAVDGVSMDDLILVFKVDPHWATSADAFAQVLSEAHTQVRPDGKPFDVVMFHKQPNPSELEILLKETSVQHAKLLGLSNVDDMYLGGVYSNFLTSEACTSESKTCRRIQVVQNKYNAYDATPQEKTLDWCNQNGAVYMGYKVFGDHDEIAKSQPVQSAANRFAAALEEKLPRVAGETKVTAIQSYGKAEQVTVDLMSKEEQVSDRTWFPIPGSKKKGHWLCVAFARRFHVLPIVKSSTATTMKLYTGIVQPNHMVWLDLNPNLVTLTLTKNGEEPKEWELGSPGVTEVWHDLTKKNDENELPKPSPDTPDAPKPSWLMQLEKTYLLWVKARTAARPDWEKHLEGGEAVISPEFAATLVKIRHGYDEWFELIKSAPVIGTPLSKRKCYKKDARIPDGNGGMMLVIGNEVVVPAKDDAAGNGVHTVEQLIKRDEKVAKFNHRASCTAVFGMTNAKDCVVLMATEWKCIETDSSKVPAFLEKVKAAQAKMTTSFLDVWQKPDNHLRVNKNRR